MTSGDNAGDYREIAAVSGTTGLVFATAFDNAIVPGDRYSISPVPFKLRAWPMQNDKVSRFSRYVMVTAGIAVDNLAGFRKNDNRWWRVSAYRNGELPDNDAYVQVSEDPEQASGSLNIDGVDLEPYIEQIATGVMFDLTGAEFSVTISDSRLVSS